MAKAQIGIIGIGTMGANLALNFAENGIGVAAFDIDPEASETLAKDSERLGGSIEAFENLGDLANALELPRVVLMMVPAGDAVDGQLDVLTEWLQKGDIVIDGGNSHFRDTMRRIETAEDHGLHFVGMGVSGGADGARHGPSLMVGGVEDVWKTLQPLVEAVAAKADDGEPCAKWMGCQGAGHFVKAAHNGIEYADMQMIAETYGLMRRGLGLDFDAMAEAFADWNKGVLKSFLIEITSDILKTDDPKTGKPVVNVILDRAAQKGTGRWTVMEAQQLAAPQVVIEAAVTARVMSSQPKLRAKAGEVFGAAPNAIPDGNLDVETLERALIAARIITYAQGFDLITIASENLDMEVPLPDVAKVWRAGCIIRCAMLDDMAKALSEDAKRNIAFAPTFEKLLKDNLPSLRKVVGVGTAHGHAIPALSAALSWFDMLRTPRSTADLIQAQRDYFGHHGFERTDEDGDHHGPWA